MTDVLFSLLRSAIQTKAEVSFELGGAVINLCPYVLYEDPTGSLRLGGMTSDDVPLDLLVEFIRNLDLTGRNFDVDPTFDLANSRYRAAHAIVVRF